MNKVCTGCNEELPLDQFSPNRKGALGTVSKCKPCRAAYKREWQRAMEATPEGKARKAARARKYNLKFNYGITPEQFDSMLSAQNNRCAICKSEIEKAGPGSAAVDHCHSTGRVRSILCIRCNLGIGHFRENAEFLAAAIKYLEAA